MRAFVGGLLVAIIVLLLFAFVAVKTGLVPARADGRPLPFERWAARASLAATIAREAPKPPYPFADTPAAEQRGATLYVQNCAVCHGTAHTTPNAIALGLSVRPPQFNKRGVDDDPPGVTYWKVSHGIRFTGMPAFGGRLDEKSLWDVTYFLAHKPADLTSAARAIWQHPQSVPGPTPLPEPRGTPGQPANTR
ncbi:MAG: cytochrome c [Candidatus Eremiobacteraeota bacterium]|nr:cytochrome c [Candidatus Eremiobacteraeota bacterium]